MNPKDKLLSIVNNAKGDNLERAEMAFRGLSDEQMKKQHGASGNSRQEILDGYKKEREEYNAARDFLLHLFDLAEA